MIHVAVADDYAPIRKALQRYFESEPDFVWAGEAADGEEAVMLVMTRHVDVLILDLAMPGLGGMLALPRLRAAAAHLRIIIFSAYAASEYERKVLQLGAIAYLEKGVGIEEVVATVRNAMQRPVAAFAGNVARRD